MLVLKYLKKNKGKEKKKKKNLKSINYFYILLESDFTYFNSFI